MKKAQKAKLMPALLWRPPVTKRQLAERLLVMARVAQERGWSAEELLRSEIKRRERALRAAEKRR